MMRHFSSVKRKVTIDECPDCGGIWLDAGELGAIRDEFASEADRHNAAQECFSQAFDKPLAQEHAADQLDLATAQQFARPLRFICPSEYLPK
jgi:Zn-finger nucleic acid-binding protein